MEDKDLNVVVKLKIMPENIEVDLKAVEKKVDTLVDEIGKVAKSEVVPIAFGLNSLESTLLLSDSTGGIDDLTDKIKEIEGVGEVEVIDLNRL